VSTALLGGLFIGALALGMGLNALYANPFSLLGYYVPGSPSEPLAPSAVPGNGNVTLHWHVPLDAGSSPITGYIVTPYVGFAAAPPQLFSAVKTTAVVTGLANGKTYFFKVAAVNGQGPSLLSLASNSVRVGAPTTPTNLKAIPGKNQATLKWVPPSSANGSRILGYIATPFLDGVAQNIHVFNSTATVGVVGGLQNGRSYTFRIAAKNANGTGLPSAASAAVLVAGAPSPPIGVSAARVSAGALRVRFTPQSGNGLAVTSFTATCSSSTGGVRKSRTGTASPITVTGLSAKRKYRCTVVGTNARGSSAPSAVSSAVVA